MIRRYLKENNLMHFLKITFPLNGEEKTINARQNRNILTARPSVVATFQQRVYETTRIYKFRKL